MFRAADILYPILHFRRDQEPAPARAEAPQAGFETDDEIGTLMPVYSEIARRLSRNAYTSHTAA
jgi:hypothetical protein